MKTFQLNDNLLFGRKLKSIPIFSAIEGLFYIGIVPSVGSFIFWNITLRHIKAWLKSCSIRSLSLPPFLAFL
ncbi:hypothetical protein AS888_13475 [Peribacillus simplex]|uniref:Uncharacterized protein n=1 Tax=Peribacillus simplex TaxID=1478 RepID=A0A125QSN4_9BACI|nr:hypothetical protein AS888_13475 [Peribacillus simplex]